MKIQLPRETLLKSLQMVAGIVGRKQTAPILSNVLFSIRDNILSITGSDSEIELIGSSPIENNELTAAITMPGRKLVDICRSLPENAAIELYSEKEKIILHSGKSRFTLSTLPATDFPQIEALSNALTTSISQSALKQLFQRTCFSIAQQDVRHYLTGLLLEISPDCLQAIASDGHRLAKTVVKMPSQVRQKTQIILPRKAVAELLRLLPDTDQLITLNFTQNHFRLSGENFIFTSKLLESRFPNYENSIPKACSKFFIIERDELKQALSRVAILCNEKFKGICLSLSANLLKIHANNPEQESAEEELTIDYNQENFDIALNVNYLLDILNVIDTGKVKLSFSDSSKGILVEEVESNWNSVFVVMPMRL